MHEYSIVQALFHRIDESVRAHQATSVRRVTVRIGELSGVDVFLLRSAYDLVRERTVCADATLDVETVPARWTCAGGHADIARGVALTCPVCRRPARLVEGDEIVLGRLELEVP